MQQIVRLCGAVVVALLVTAGGAAGQRMSSIEVGVVAPGHGSVLQVGYRFSSADRNALGIDVSVATLPEALVDRIALIGADLDAAFLLSPTSGLGLIARAGPSMIAGVGAGGGAAVFGYNLGAGVLIRTGSHGALRMDYTYRRFSLDGDRISLPSLTIGFGWLH
ncbi:MAG: hypothetical protein ACRD08_08235 [Acidimicrobiales bacterium]